MSGAAVRGRGRPATRKRAAQRRAFAALGVLTALAVAPVFVIFGYVMARGLPAMSWEFVSSPPREMMRAGGIFPAIVGTLYLVAGTALVAFPLGIGAAIYLGEYARPGRLSGLVRLAVVNLAGVPSVVYGLFGLGLFVVFLNFGASILAGSLTLGLLILPAVITASEEALRAVPPSYREASLALGATRWQTVRYAVLPLALPGMLTGAILGIGRAAGETAPILFTAAAFYLPGLPSSVFDQVMALPYHLFIISTEVPGVAPHVRYGTAFVLLGIVAALNLSVGLVRARLRRGR